MSLTNTHEEDLLQHYFTNANHANIGDATGLVASTTAGSLYVSLHTADPGEGGSDVNEVSGGSYAREGVARSGAGWTVSGSNCSNAAAITFTQATANWGTITHFGIHYDLAGASSMIAYGALTSSVVINSSDQFEFAIGDLDVNLD